MGLMNANLAARVANTFRSVEPELFGASEYTSRGVSAFDRAEYNARRGDILRRRAMGRELRMQEKGVGGQQSFNFNTPWSEFRANTVNNATPMTQKINVAPHIFNSGGGPGGFKSPNSFNRRELVDGFFPKTKSIFGSVWENASSNTGAFKSFASAPFKMALVGGLAGAAIGGVGNLLAPGLAGTDDHMVKNAMLTGAVVGAMGAAGGFAKAFKGVSAMNANIKPWMLNGANMVEKAMTSKLTMGAIGIGAFAGQIDTRFTQALNRQDHV